MFSLLILLLFIHELVKQLLETLLCLGCLINHSKFFFEDYDGILDILELHFHQGPLKLFKRDAFSTRLNLVKPRVQQVIKVSINLLEAEESLHLWQLVYPRAAEEGLAFAPLVQSITIGICRLESVLKLSFIQAETILLLKFLRKGIKMEVVLEAESLQPIVELQ